MMPEKCNHAEAQQQRKGRELSTTRRRHVRLAPWKKKGAATVVMAVVAVTAASFSSSLSSTAVSAFMLPGPGSTPTSGKQRRHEPHHPPTALNVLMDADVLLQDGVRNGPDFRRLLSQHNKEEGFAVQIVADVSLETTSGGKKNKGNNNNNKARNQPRVSMYTNPQQQQRQLQQRKNAGGRSRSSTMPGFATASDKQKAFKDGIRIVEERSGRKFVDTPEKQRKRRKMNGENMYKNSPSVPDSLVQFADEIHQEERISRKEEIELGEKTQEAIRLQNLYDMLEAKLQREPTDEEWCAAAGRINMEAIGQAIEEGLAAKNKLVTSNLRMVQSVVNTYIRNGLSAQYNAADMMQEGIVALIRAAEKFEPDRGFKFSTYAMYWVRASVKRSQIYQSRVVTVPQRLFENHKRLLRIEHEMVAETGKKPTRKELGEVVGMSELQVNRCFAAMEQRCYSLDQQLQNGLKPSSMGGGPRDTLIEIVESTTVDRENNQLQEVLLREDLIEALNRHLTPEEVEILLLRYGLKEVPDTNRKNFSNGNTQVTIAELSRILGLKPDKVRRMINKSLKQLQGAGMEEWLAFERDLP